VFSAIPADAEVKSVVRNFYTENTGVVPVVEKDGSLVGVVEAHDLLKEISNPVKARDIARQDYVVAHPGETVDRVTRRMISQNADNVVVVDGNGTSKPIGVARAADILRLRRWVMEEEGHAAEALEVHAASKTS
jgi:predicted transcriptional regulator